MNTYFSTQDSRPTPQITDGLRRYSGIDNPRYLISNTRTTPVHSPVKVELISDIKKTIDQTKEEMATIKPAVKRKRNTTVKKSAKRRKVTPTKYKKKPVTKKRSLSKKSPKRKQPKK